jgi:hypothetical protein
MIETEITILINKKTDLESIRQIVIDKRIQVPIYIFEYENHYRIEIVSDYEEWELDSELLKIFPEYEFSSDLERGRKEIRLQISRYQSGLSTDSWGRPPENTINETKYLIKKSNDKPERFSPQIKVLFEDSEQYYYINIINGINKTSGEKGFLLLNDFKNRNDENDAEILKDRLYKSPIDAFHSGYHKMKEQVNRDFEEYIENKKKELREQHKVPRKIVRDFINSCNKSDIDGIFVNLDEKVIFEKIDNWQTKLKIDGINEFKEYIKSPTQDLCARDFKIRSSWNCSLPIITIGVKFSPSPPNKEHQENNLLQYWQIRFVLKNDKIVGIIVENRI